MELVQNIHGETIPAKLINDNVVQVKVEPGAKEVLVQFLK